MSTDDKLRQFDEETADKRRALVAECQILDALPEGPPWKVHVRQRCGMDASARFEHNFFAYGQDVRQPTLDDVAELARLLPPVPLVLVRDSCVSIRTREYVDSLPEKTKELWDSETDISPAYVKVSAFQHPTATVSWCTQLGERIVQIKITVPLCPEIGQFDIERKRTQGTHHAGNITSCRFKPNVELTTIFRGGEPLAQLESPIKWGSGSPDVPNDYTLYFVHLSDDVVMTAADIVSTIKKG